jgi:hypothetical protein
MRSPLEGNAAFWALAQESGANLLESAWHSTCFVESMNRHTKRSLRETFEERWLRGVFERALGTALAASFVGAGCGGPQNVACDSPTPLDLAAVKPSVPFDFAALREGLGNDSHFLEKQHVGQPCSGASDAAACQAALDALGTFDLSTNVLGGCGMAGCTYIVTTTGDSAQRFATRQEYLAFLGPIDSTADARLLLEFDGYAICDDSHVQQTQGAFLASATILLDDCPVRRAAVTVKVSVSGQVSELSRHELSNDGTTACIGRRPAGLIPVRVVAMRMTLGEHFAAIAELEAASVVAFEVLALELAQHGAPAALVAGARAAAQDEVRHAHATAALARRFGATPLAPRIRQRPLRSLLELALDNAAEGCVRETYGALIGHHQAAVARDAEIAAVMRVIAADETRHAALAFQLDAWFTPRLTSHERAQVAAARGQAVVSLCRELEAPMSTDQRKLAGIPAASTTATLLASLSSELWSPRTHSRA